MKEIVSVFKLDTGTSEKTIKELKNEINGLKKELDNAQIGSKEFADKSIELAKAQQELKKVLDISKQSIGYAEGSYNALVSTMSKLKQEWKATTDVAKREEIGKQIDKINTELKELDATLGNHQRNVGNYKEDIENAFANINTEVMDYGKELANANKETEVSRNALDGLGKMASGLAGGFASLQGIIALTGAESEDFEKIMIKVTSAMSIAQGVGSMKGLIEGFSQLNTSIKAVQMSAKALSSGGVGLIIGAITAIGTAIGVVIAKKKELDNEINNNSSLENYLNGLGKVAKTMKEDVNTQMVENIVKIKELQTNYNNLGDDLNAKKKFIEENADAFKSLGIEVTSVEEAESVLIENTDDYVKAMQKRAEAEILREQALEEYREYLEKKQEIEEKIAIANEDKITGDNRSKNFWQKLIDGFAGVSTMYGATAEVVAETIADSNKEVATKVSDSLQQELDALEAKATQDFKDTFEYINKLLKEADELTGSKKSTKEEVQLNPDEEALKLQKEINLALKDERTKELENLKESFVTRYQILEKNNIDTTELVKLYAKEATDIVIRYNGERIKSEELTGLSIEDAKKKELDFIRQNYVQNLNELQAYGVNSIDLLTAYLIQEETIRQEYAQQEIEQEKNKQNLINELKYSLFTDEEKKNADKEKEIADLNERMAVIKSTYQLNKEEMLLIDEWYLSELDRINDKYTKSEKKKISDLLSFMSDGAKQKVAQTSATIATMTNSTSMLLQAVANKQDEKTREGFEKSKKLQIASAKINIASGIASALAGLFTTKTGPWDLILAATQAATIAASGKAQIEAIKEQEFDGGGGGGSTISTPNVSTPNVGTSSNVSVMPNVDIAKSVQIDGNANYINGGGTDTNLNVPQMVYVLESDITDTQNKVRLAEGNSNF